MSNKMREALLMIATGQKGIGKSYTTIFRELLPRFRDGERNILIFDINDEYGTIEANEQCDINTLKGQKKIRIPALSKYDVVKFSMLPSGQKQIRRIRPIHDRDVYDKRGSKPKLLYRKGQRWNSKFTEQALLDILEDYRNGILLIEDITGIFGNNIPHEIMSAITRNRHVAQDIIVHLQSISPILPRFWQNTNFTRYHKQIDGVDKSKHKLCDKYELYKITENIVNEKYEVNPRYYVYVNNDAVKIMGAFTKQDMNKAIEKYLYETPNVYRYLLNLTDNNTKKKYTTESAVKIKASELLKKYYGNNM